MALLALIDITQQFKAGYSLKAVNLTVDQGDVFALIGPTGSGKTTLIRIIDLLDWPVSGRIIFDGKDVTHSKHERLQARRRMAYVQQRPTVFNMSVHDNVAIPLRWRRVPRQTIRSRVEQALDLVGLLDYQKRDARTLSGGETQRVAIARALVTEPSLLLLDEPTANLDPVTIEKIEEVLGNIIQTEKTTIIMSTHDREQGQRLATKMGVLIKGKLMQVGTPDEIFRAPARKRVAEFVGVGNMLSGTVSEKIKEGLTIVQVNGITIQTTANVDTGTRVWVLIRSEDITFSLEQTTTSARNSFSGPITRITPIGALVRVEIDCGFPLIGVITASTWSEMELYPGKRIFASFKATAVGLIGRRT